MRCLALLAPLLVLAPISTAQVPRSHDLVRKEHLIAVGTDDLVSGKLLHVHGGPPWHVRSFAKSNGGQLLRRFGRNLFVVATSAGTIRRVPIDGSSAQDYDLGPASLPQDVLVPGPTVQLSPHAYVTRRDDPCLLRLDLVTGAGTDVVDLGPVGGGAEIALGTMARDGTRLFVQVKVLTDPRTGQDAGVLAVVDLEGETLVDVDPDEPGVQGIELAGAPPRFAMQILPGTRTLYVSSTESFLDERGGIEMVDLDALESIGFALTEEAGGSDMGGFVMVSPDEGYYVFHTDFAASTHLKHFTVGGGPDPGPEIVVFLGDMVDRLAYDPHFQRVFLPGGFGGASPVIHVIDAEIVQPIEPIDTGIRTHDVLVAR